MVSLALGTYECISSFTRLQKEDVLRIRTYFGDEGCRKIMQSFPDPTGYSCVLALLQDLTTISSTLASNTVRYGRPGLVPGEDWEAVEVCLHILLPYHMTNRLACRHFHNYLPYGYTSNPDPPIWVSWMSRAALNSGRVRWGE